LGEEGEGEKEGEGEGEGGGKERGDGCCQLAKACFSMGTKFFYIRQFNFSYPLVFHLISDHIVCLFYSLPCFNSRRVMSGAWWPTSI
jgi:hypothetical protein